MKITKEQLRQIIKEELSHVLNEGPLADAQAKVPKNTGNAFINAFHTLEYLSGPNASLVNWVQNAEGQIKRGNRDAAKALDIVKAAFRKERELAEVEHEESKGMKFPKFKGLEDIAMELEDAYNSPSAGSMATAPNFVVLGGYISSVYKMEDYANMLQFREGDWKELNPSKDWKDLTRLVNWIDRFHKAIR